MNKPKIELGKQLHFKVSKKSRIVGINLTKIVNHVHWNHKLLLIKIKATLNVSVFMCWEMIIKSFMFS